MPLSPERPPVCLHAVCVGEAGSAFANWLAQLEPFGFQIELCDGPECLIRTLRESVIHLVIIADQHPAGDPAQLAGLLWNAPISTPMFVASPAPTPTHPASWANAGVHWVFSLTEPAGEIAPALRRMVDRSEHLRSAEATVKVLQSQLTGDRKRFQDLGRTIREFNHEITTPLAVIQGYCANLADGISGPLSPDQQQIVKRLQFACGMMCEVLGQLKEKAPRPETIQVRQLDPRVHQRRQLRLPKVVAEVISLMERTYKAQGVALHLEADPGCPPVWAEQARISQLLVNLLSNALRHTPAGGRVQVRVRTSKRDRLDGVELIVADSGCGIPKEHQQHIFVSGWTSARGDEKRSGLGLTICKEVAAEHRAKLWVESAPEEGAAFHLLIPRDPRQKQRKAAVQLVEDIALAGQLLMELHQRGVEIEELSSEDAEVLAQTLVDSGQTTFLLGANDPRMTRALSFVRGGQP